MQPTDPSERHLGDRAFEFRIAMSAVTVFILTFIALFYPFQWVVVAFALAYAAYKLRYYRNRINTFTSEKRSVASDRFEVLLLAFVGVSVVVLILIETVFEEGWELGGFLSLPHVELTDIDFLLDNPDLVFAWVVTLAPVAVLTYVTVKFRHRLLIGLDSEDAAIRAAIWDSFARVPLYLLWMGILTLAPIFEIWRLIPDELGEAFGLESELVTHPFSLLFGDTFVSILAVGIGIPVLVMGSYLAVQRGKYEDTTIPELLGYHGALSSSKQIHTMNIVVPVGLALLTVAVVFLSLSEIPVATLPFVVGLGVAVLVGSDILGHTSMLVDRTSNRIVRAFDPVVIGVVLGLGALAVIQLLLGSGSALSTVGLVYLAFVPPVTVAGNWLASRQMDATLSDYISRVEEDPDAVDEQTADQLFIYARSSNPVLRVTALEGLASSVRVSAYRNREAVDIFAELTTRRDESDEVVQAALQGMATVLSYDSSVETYEQLAGAGVTEWIDTHLQSEDPGTRMAAAETAARLFTRELEHSAVPATEQLQQARLETLQDVARAQTERSSVTDAVLEYVATLWYELNRSESETAMLDQTPQRLLESSLWLSPDADPNVRLKTIYALTSSRVVADSTRFARARDQLDSDSEETRFLAAHIVRSSMDHHSEDIDREQLLALLEDSSAAVRRIGAQTVATYVAFTPGAHPQLRDRLILHLEDHQAEPSQPEAAVIRTLEAMELPALVDHPTLSSTLAEYLLQPNQLVAAPAARLLSVLIQSKHTIAHDETVQEALDSGLTHPRESVRLHCLDAVVCVTDESVHRGTRFISGLAWNLDSEGDAGILSAVTLSKLLDSYPEEGVDVIPVLAKGLTNLTPVDRQSVPFLVRGTTVSEVVVDVLTDVLPLDPEAGEPLIDPLVELASTADPETLDAIMELLEILSPAYPAEFKRAVVISTAALESGRTSTRRKAVHVLANVAASHPESVEPSVAQLILLTDDDSPRVRAPALVALTNVCTALPTAIESDVHRVVGLLDDDSATVRQRAAELIVTLAERKPEIVEPAAETADRLRRLQRDPAVDYDAEQLQDASAAIQGGVPVGDDSGQDREAIWSPETADEMGSSGDTEVFEPVGDDFDALFDDDMDDEDDIDDFGEEGGDDDPAESVDEEATVIQREEKHEDDDEEETDSAEDVDEHETVIQREPDDDGEDSSEDIDEHETVIQREPDDGGDDENLVEDVDEHETVIQRDPDDGGDDENLVEDVDEQATVIKRDPDDGGEDSTEGVDEHETVIQRDPDDDDEDEDDDSVEDVDDHATVIRRDGDESDDDDR